ncbi:MAG: hypothetical protein KF752_08500 [Pirellulaceae bacterium]|nr:hypothetical protein [Pirellulaceae bacterium]
MAPLILLMATLGFIWYGAQLDHRVLSNKYLRMAEAETVSWQRKLKATRSTTVQPRGLLKDDLTVLSDQERPNDHRQFSLSRYGEMLYRRAELLRPNNEHKLMIGATMIERGAVTDGRRMLRGIAPDYRRGDMRAHSVLASSILEELRETDDTSMVDELLHHADMAAAWPSAPIDVLVAASNLHWQRKNHERSIEVLQLASKRAPDLNTLLYERAQEAGYGRIAEEARDAGLRYLSQLLARDPSRDTVRVAIVRLINTDRVEGLAHAEQLLLDGLALGPSKLISRALSEIYRIRFTQIWEESRGMNADFSVLDTAFMLDPSNPLVTGQIERLREYDFQDGSALRKELDRILAQGAAAVAVHAVLAEHAIKVGENQSIQLHLEQVVRTAPTAIKYAHLLVQHYLQNSQADLALETAQRSVAALESEGLMGERYSYELLESLADVHSTLVRFSDAIDVLLQCVKLDPSRKSARYKLALLYRQTGDIAEAEHQERAIARIELAELESQRAADAEAAQTLTPPSQIESSPETDLQMRAEPDIAPEETSPLPADASQTSGGLSRSLVDTEPLQSEESQSSSEAPLQSPAGLTSASSDTVQLP